MADTELAEQFLSEQKENLSKRESLKADYVRHSKDLFEFNKELENEKWIQENKDKISEIIISEREFNRKNTEQYLLLEKKKYADKAISTAHLSLEQIKIIFDFTDDEMKRFYKI